MVEADVVAVQRNIVLESMQGSRLTAESQLRQRREGEGMPSEEDQIERDGTAPNQQMSGDANQEREFIHLPGIISDEFGISRSQARLEIVTGEVFADGERLSGNEDLERESVAGKTIEVKGQTRTFRFQIDPTP
jgi:hypothetical protein